MTKLPLDVLYTDYVSGALCVYQRKTATKLQSLAVEFLLICFQNLKEKQCDAKIREYLKLYRYRWWKKYCI